MNEEPRDNPRLLFEHLQERLEAERARLRQWEAVEPEYHRRCTEELFPLEARFHQVRNKLVLCLDHAHKQMKLSKAEREIVSDLLTGFAGELLSLASRVELPADCDTMRLETLYKKHSGSDYAVDAAQDEEDARRILAESLGMESPDELADLSRLELAQLIFDGPYEDGEVDELLDVARLAFPLPMTNDIAWQVLQAAERERREEAASNPVLQASVGAAHELTDDRLPEANATLEIQIYDALTQFIYAQESFKLRYDLDPFGTLAPETALEDLEADIADVREYIRELEYQVMQCSDEASFKAWIKAVKREITALSRRLDRA